MGQEQPAGEASALSERVRSLGRLLLPAEAVEDRCDEIGLPDHSDALHARVAAWAGHDNHREYLEQKVRPGHPAAQSGPAVAGIGLGHAEAAEDSTFPAREAQTPT